MPPSFLKSRFGKFLKSVFLSHLVILSMFTGPCHCSDDLFRKFAPWASVLISFIFEFGIASYARVCLNLCLAVLERSIVQSWFYILACLFG